MMRALQFGQFYRWRKTNIILLATSSLHSACLHDRFIITGWASRNESVTELFPAFAEGGASNLLPLTKLAGNALVWGE